VYLRPRTERQRGDVATDDVPIEDRVERRVPELEHRASHGGHVGVQGDSGGQSSAENGQDAPGARSVCQN
jgi:hypothetical protein